ncbi:MAG: glycosyltransferase [Bacteroidota bacterium]
MDIKVYILLPVHNRKDITLKFVSLLKQQEYINYKLILIDDGSVDGTAELVSDELPQTIVIRGKGNWWWGGSLQEGYKWLRKQKLNETDVVLIMNDDTEIESDFISKGLSILAENKKTLLLATAYNIKTGELDDNGVYFDFKNNNISPSDVNHSLNCLSTRGLFLKAKDFISLGGFYPLLLPHYFSDYEFTIRAHRKGYRLICSDDVKLWFDDTTSGIHNKDIVSKQWTKFWKMYFSKRYTGNPIYAINFYLIAFPFPYNIKHAYLTFKSFIKTFFYVLKFNLS